MIIRNASPSDGDAVAAIYAPIVRDTAISFELIPPTPEEMRERITESLKRLPWLVSLDDSGSVNGYVYASRHRERAAYRWSVDTTAYVRADSRGRGVGTKLYAQLFEELARLGYFQAFAGIALPNDGSIALHRSVGFGPIGVYARVGYKLGRWHDVSWWQKSIQPSRHPPREPLPIG